jgi:hypothetical protein
MSVTLRCETLSDCISLGGLVESMVLTRTRV